MNRNPRNLRIARVLLVFFAIMAVIGLISAIIRWDWWTVIILAASVIAWFLGGWMGEQINERDADNIQWGDEE